MTLWAALSVSLLAAGCGSKPRRAVTSDAGVASGGNRGGGRRGNGVNAGAGPADAATDTSDRDVAADMAAGNDAARTSRRRATRGRPTHRRGGTERRRALSRGARPVQGRLVLVEPSPAREQHLVDVRPVALGRLGGRVRGDGPHGRNAGRTSRPPRRGRPRSRRWAAANPSGRRRRRGSPPAQRRGDQPEQPERTFFGSFPQAAPPRTTSGLERQRRSRSTGRRRLTEDTVEIPAKP